MLFYKICDAKISKGFLILEERENILVKQDASNIDFNYFA